MESIVAWIFSSGVAVSGLILCALGASFIPCIVRGIRDRDISFALDCAFGAFVTLFMGGIILGYGIHLIILRSC